MRRVAAMAIISLVAVAAACAADGEPQLTETESLSHKIERFIDHEAQVVCWFRNGSRKFGISCLPFDETDLTILAPGVMPVGRGGEIK